jgi:hypothetical protein
MKYRGDDLMTAGITAANMHRGDVPQSAHEETIGQLKSTAAAEGIVSRRWGHVAETLINARNTFRDVDSERSIHTARHIPEAVDLFKRAASSLGPFIAEAVRQQREHGAKGDQAWQAAIAAEAEQRNANPLPGRTNIEMDNLLRVDTATLRQECIAFCERFLAWADSLPPLPDEETPE